MSLAQAGVQDLDHLFPKGQIGLPLTVQNYCKESVKTSHKESLL